MDVLNKTAKDDQHFDFIGGATARPSLSLEAGAHEVQRKGSQAGASSSTDHRASSSSDGVAPSAAGVDRHSAHVLSVNVPQEKKDGDGSSGHKDSGGNVQSPTAHAAAQADAERLDTLICAWQTSPETLQLNK